MDSRNKDDVVKIGLLIGSFDPPTISHLQMASETLNLQLANEIWMIPCCNRSHNHLITGEQRLEMLTKSISDFFPASFPVKINDIQVKSEEEIDTYQML